MSQFWTPSKMVTQHFSAPPSAPIMPGTGTHDRPTTKTRLTYETGLIGHGLNVAPQDESLWLRPQVSRPARSR